MTNDSLIQLDSIKKVFLTDEVETHALAGVHFDIRRGEYVSISGPSGCGKSTLLAILGLLDTPSEGTYTLNGTPGRRHRRQRTRADPQPEIGFIFQAFNLIGDLTVFENVELPLTYRDGVSKAERRERAIGSARARRHGASRQALSRRSSPAVSSSASPSRARWSASPRSCSPTNRPATSTRRTAKR